jgi:hypothetical protein
MKVGDWQQELRQKMVESGGNGSMLDFDWKKTKFR